MPLPPPDDREEMHIRRVECRGFRRADGLWDIEGHLTDVKKYEISSKWRQVPPGMPVHDMWLRLTIDVDLVIHQVAAVTDASPYPSCPGGATAMQALCGLKIGRGWRAEVDRRLGGNLGCTHLVELLGPVATTAYQALGTIRRQRPDVLNAQGRPVKIDSCYAYAAHREAVHEKWPEHYTGKATA